VLFDQAIERRHIASVESILKLDGQGDPAGNISGSCTTPV
jgi:hypothetical protein